MSGDYISREAAIKEVYRFDGYLDDDLEWRLHYALKKLPAADVVERPRWIPVTERLPEKDGDYLCWLLGYRLVLRWDGKDWWYVSIGDAYTSHVTHWQILPEPPEDAP